MSVLSVPNTFVPAATILSGQVNANFSSIVAWATTQQGLTINPLSVPGVGVTGKWPDQVLTVGTVVSNNFASWRAAVTAIGTATHLWALSDPTGTVAVDAIGASNGTYVGGPTLGAPLLRQSGVGLVGNQYVTFPAAELPATAPWSFEAYASSGSGAGYIVSTANVGLVQNDTTHAVAIAQNPAVAIPCGTYANETQFGVDSIGNVWIATSSTNIAQISQRGTVLQNITVPADTTRNNVFVDSSNNVWVTQTANNQVLKYSSAGAPLLTLSNLLLNPVASVVDSLGNIYVLSNNTIRKFPPTGGASTLVSIPGPAAALAIAIDSVNNLYISSQNPTNTVYKYTTAGGAATATFAYSTAPGNLFTVGSTLYALTGTALYSVPTSGGSPALAFSTTLIVGTSDSAGGIYLVNTATAPYNVYRYTPGFATPQAAGLTLVAPTPNHYVVTYDGATLRLYIDGAFSGSALANNIMVGLGNPMTVGTNTNALGTNLFQGTVGNIVTYSTALTGAQISSIYNAI